MKITIAHSPDSDDAFMFYGLANGGSRPASSRSSHVLTDIETLNRHAQEGRHEVTAISFHAYPYVADKLRAACRAGAASATATGRCSSPASRWTPSGSRGRRWPCPARSHRPTSRCSCSRPGVADARRAVRPDPRRGAGGRADVGLIIHEGQLTYGGAGAGQGRWTSARGGRTRPGLPLPLGGNAVRRDLGPRDDGAARRGSCARRCSTRSPTDRRRSSTR